MEYGPVEPNTLVMQHECFDPAIDYRLLEANRVVTHHLHFDPAENYRPVSDRVVGPPGHSDTCSTSSILPAIEISTP